MGSWDTVLNAVTWLGDYLGLATRNQRIARGAVLKDLTAFHLRVLQVCGASIEPGSVAGTPLQEFDSMSSSSDWGKRAIARYHFARHTEGPIAAQAMKDATQDCQEYKALFEKIRG
jgi:hypothetical protein